MRPRTILSLCLGIAALAARQAAAGESFLDGLFGGSGHAPPNPFASNYPSAPPSAKALREARRRQAERGGPPGPERGPVPPAPVPED